MLVLASKYVGEKCLQYLVNAGYKIDILLVATEDDAVMFSMVGDQTRCEVYSKALADELVDSAIHFDWLLNLWSPHILSDEFLGLAARRVNIHPALVPWCKGNDNAAWVIRENCYAGVSLLEMNSEIDAADLWVQEKLEFSFPITGKQLHQKLQDKCIQVFLKYWPDIESGKISLKTQTPGGSYHTRKQTNIDRIADDDMMMTAQQWTRWALAHDFAPGTTAEITIDGRKYGIKLELFPIKDEL